MHNWQTELIGILGARATTQRGICDEHAGGAGYQPGHNPDMVCFCHSTEEVAAVLKIADAHTVPVTAFGAGTSVEGHVIPVKGGISLDLSQMTRILEVNRDDMDCRIEAGVRREELNSHLRDTGLFFPIDPGANATLGGMAATRASGTNAVRYGTMREQILGLTVVMADGSVIQTGGRARKSSAGYDLNHLFVGQEGTLGIVTELRIKLHPIPEALTAAVCQFPDLPDAVDCVVAIMQSAIPVSRIELLDDKQMGASIAYSKLTGFDAKPTLFFELGGSQSAVEEQAELMAGLADSFGGSAFQWATRQEDRTALWKARHDALWAAMTLAPGKAPLSTDVCVPISNLAEAVTRARGHIDKAGITGTIVGHVGDGNFHCILFADQADSDEWSRLWEVDKAIVADALALGGTCTGEHGIGIGKREFLRTEHGAGVDVMAKIKQALDPKGLLNPGKIFAD